LQRIRSLCQLSDRSLAIFVLISRLLVASVDEHPVKTLGKKTPDEPLRPIIQVVNPCNDKKKKGAGGGK
ncbi:MAG: hypothetical protein ACFCUX_10380, partial [Candidatus Methylacidiphilales bacterium]